MRIRVIDAFTDRPFAGNPAAVCVLDANGWPPEQWMQQVAAEMNLSETAFVATLDNDPDAEWALRWFTPVLEEKLCGHATLAAAHALWSDGIMASCLRFRTLSGVLLAYLLPNGAIALDFPIARPRPQSIPDGLVDALGAQPDAVYGTGQLGDVLAIFPNETAIHRLTPDLGALARVTRQHAIRGVTATAKADPAHEYDFVSRFFSPADGIPEDPVTGSAHTALAPFWSELLGRRQLTGLQASPRSGLVRTELHGDRVFLTGHAVTVLDGQLVV